MKNKRYSLSRTQMIALGFAIIILTGTILLMLPISTKNGQTTNFVDALLTATSATCVTGLVSYDTFVHWTLFGQIVIICLIQIGGLGFITFGVYGMMLFRKRVDLKGRELIHDSLNSMHLGGGTGLVKSVIKGTLLFEGLGALILSVRFAQDMGVLKGIYYGIFHSISAFCNTGFDLMGCTGQFSSLCSYSDDITVNFVVISLILIGGLGFFVWGDIYKNKFNFKNYALHSKIVLTFSFILVVGGAVFFYFSESNGAFRDMAFKEKVLASIFSAVTPRTAGFNTVDTAMLSEAGKAFTVFLMFIGGNPGSTAGGIKTTTVAAIFFFVISYLKKEKGSRIYKRSLENDLIKKASIVFFVNFTLAFIAVFIILLNQDISLTDAVFECFSAIGTVGMTTGITRQLSFISKIVVIILMYCGRIGSLSFALSFSEHRKVLDIQYPTEEILIG